MNFVFTKYAEKQFLKLEIKIQQRIKNKLIILKQDKNLFDQNIKAIISIKPITHRIRVGSHRLLLKQEGQNYIILKVGHRKEIY